MNFNKILIFKVNFLLTFYKGANHCDNHNLRLNKSNISRL
jgi:hypothetical protein